MAIIWPVATSKGRHPIISNEFRKADHLGVDLMFARTPDDPPYAPSDPRGTKTFYVPSGALVVAATDGYVLYAKQAPNGYRVRLAHANDWPWQTLYLHLFDLRVSPGQLVTAGQPLGLVGGDPTNNDPRHVIHLHFERRDGDNRPADPAPWLAGATYV